MEVQYRCGGACPSGASSTCWQEPDPEAYPAGQDLYTLYLKPLSELLQIAPHLLVSSRVLSVTRRGMGKMKDADWEEAPFQILALDSSGAETVYYARAVIDASGTYHSLNLLGATNSVPAGELAAAEGIVYHQVHNEHFHR